ncbi:MAG: hypothetical protein FJ316_05485 [SAR202 cluster bacterium]|nr:hypothetical protein [SAR202 cluster bacterium]
MESGAKLAAKERDSLVQRLIESYRKEPDRLREALPEVADYLDKLLAQAPLFKDRETPFGLTDRERAFHRESLEKVLK